MAEKSHATVRAPSAYKVMDRDLERHLVRRAQEGDMTAFEALVCGHERGLYGFLRLRCPSEDESADLVQEVFLKVYRNLHRFDGGRSRFKTWLYTVALNLWKDGLKREGRRPRCVAVDPALPARGDAFAAVDAVQRFQGLVGQLDDESAEVITLRFANDLGYAEIHEITGLGENTIRSKVHRALKRLREWVETHGH